MRFIETFNLGNDASKVRSNSSMLFLALVFLSMTCLHRTVRPLYRIPSNYSMKFAAFGISLWVELLQTRAVQLLVFCELLLLGQNNSKHPASSGNNIQNRFLIKHKLKVTNTLSFVTIFYTMTCQPQDFSRLLHFQIIFFLCRYMYCTILEKEFWISF